MRKLGKPKRLLGTMAPRGTVHPPKRLIRVETWSKPEVPMRPITRAVIGFVGSFATFLSSGVALSDPCGMVPPIYVTDNTSIVRVGDEQTYVFYKDGIETFVIRPGFSGKVEDFGMLISFPTPPALRKVSEDIFPQIAKAIDPPEVVVDVRYREEVASLALAGTPGNGRARGSSETA